MKRFKEIDLTPPSQKELLEFNRLAGFAPLFEQEEPEPVDLSDEQIDPEEQIDPDDASERDKKEMQWKQAVDIMDKKKIVYDGARTGTSKKKNKK